MGAVGFRRRQGADGLHVSCRCRRTPRKAGRIWGQIVATMVATKHPKVATVERTVSKRGAKVYVDYLQNIEARRWRAYSARASSIAASAPLTWDEVHRGVDRRDFTIVTMPRRLEEVGDLWKPLFKARAPRLDKIGARLADHHVGAGPSAETRLSRGHRSIRTASIVLDRALPGLRRAATAYIFRL